MTITATIIADSIAHNCPRLTTMQLRYPRFIHAEFMTHRVFSRNASSSRAIPVERLIQDVVRDPVEPMHWGKNQPGMQAREELTGSEKWDAQHEWRHARREAIKSARVLAQIGAHKQIVNRLLEPFSHINVLVTSTEWDNFFKLRLHPDAQPEIQELARVMSAALNKSEPRSLRGHQWHLPYIENPDDLDDLTVARKVSVARCARVSYLTHDDRATTVEEDLALYERLVRSNPPHMSPAEHQAVPDQRYQRGVISHWSAEHLHGNFTGWRQQRKMLEDGIFTD